MTEIWRVYVCSHRSPFRWTLILRGTKLHAWEVFDSWWRRTEKGDGLRLVLEIGPKQGRILLELWHPDRKKDLREYTRKHAMRGRVDQPSTFTAVRNVPLGANSI